MPFPSEIITNILLRLPIRSLIQCICVCKTWRTIISDPIFSTYRINRASATNTDLLLIGDHGCAFFVEDNESDQHHDSEEEDDCPIIKLFYNVDFLSTDDKRIKWASVAGMSVCNGLCCLPTIPTVKKKTGPIRILNPITQECQQLPNFTTPKCNEVLSYMYAFGFDISEEKFKVALFLSYDTSTDSDIDIDIESDSESDSIDLNITTETQVHTLGSDSWRRKMDNVPSILFYAHNLFFDVCVNGSLYLIPKLKAAISELRIISFHLGCEDFRDIETPKIAPAKDLSLHYYALGELEKCLTLTDSSHVDFIDIWLMKNDGGKESWIKKFCIYKQLIGRPLWLDIPFVPLKYQRNGEILLLHKKYLVAYSAQSNTCKLFDINGVYPSISSIEAFPFVGSLISVKSICGVDNKT